MKKNGPVLWQKTALCIWETAIPKSAVHWYRNCMKELRTKRNRLFCMKSQWKKSDRCLSAGGWHGRCTFSGGGYHRGCAGRIPFPEYYGCAAGSSAYRIELFYQLACQASASPFVWNFKTVHQVQEGDLDVRISVDSSEEMGNLARS